MARDEPDPEREPDPPPHVSDDDLDQEQTERLVEALYRRTGPRGSLVVLFTYDLNTKQERTSMSYRGGWTCVIGALVENLFRTLFPAQIAGREPQGDGDKRGGQ
jgi:hypothetical protein